jgi:UPF0148 protein
MKEMAALLRKGAKMLSISCPECSSPLFQLKTGEIFCPSCKREVKIVKEGEDVEKDVLWAEMEKTLAGKLPMIRRQLESETDPERVRELSETISTILGALERLQRITTNS